MFAIFRCFCFLVCFFFASTTIIGYTHLVTYCGLFSPYCTNIQIRKTPTISSNQDLFTLFQAWTWPNLILVKRNEILTRVIIDLFNTSNTNMHYYCGTLARTGDCKPTIYTYIFMHVCKWVSIKKAICSYHEDKSMCVKSNTT